MTEWVKVQLLKRYPDLVSKGGADLDGNGRVDDRERFKDFDGNGVVGNGKDFTAYYRVNKAAIEKSIPYFTWASAFDINNPIHEALSIESAHSAAATIRAAYGMLAAYLAAVGKKRSAGKVGIADMYKVLVGDGIKISDAYPLVAEGTHKRALTPDVAHIIIAGIAWQLGLATIRFVVLPSSTCLKDGRTYYKVEFGPALRMVTAQSLAREFLIPRSAMRQRAYLVGLNRKRMRGHINYFYGERALRDKKYAVAQTFFTKAIRLYPTHVDALRGIGTAQYHLGNVLGAQNYLSRAIAIDSHDELSYFARVRVWLELRDGQRARMDLNSSCKPQGAQRRPVHPRCVSIPRIGP